MLKNLLILGILLNTLDITVKCTPVVNTTPSTGDVAIEKLGFVTKLRTIRLASLTRKQKVRLIAKIGFTLAEATAELQYL